MKKILPVLCVLFLFASCSKPQESEVKMRKVVVALDGTVPEGLEGEALSLWLTNSQKTVSAVLLYEEESCTYKGEIAELSSPSTAIAALGLVAHSSDPQYVALKTPYAVFKGEDDGTGVLTLSLVQQSCCLAIDLSVNGTSLSGQHPLSLKLMSSTPLTGASVVNLNTLEYVHFGKVKEMETSFDDSVSLEGLLHVTFPIAIEEIVAGATMQVTLKTKEKYSVEINYEFAVSHSTDEPIPIVLDVHQLEEGGQAVVYEPMVNLTEKGTANCYIIGEPDRYTFMPAKGNSAVALEGVVEVSVLWTTSRGLVENLTINKKSGMIEFTSDAKGGNALVAAFDAQGQVLWSWHIWAPGVSEIPLHYTTNSAYMTMNYNLGATSTATDSPDTYGVYYQWGRKDPFPGAKIIGTGSKREESTAFTTATVEVFTDETHPEHSLKTLNKTNITAGEEIDWMIKHPTIFVGVADQNDDWIVQESIEDYQSLWGWNASTKDNVKTIYDPCPLGYKVPSSSNNTWSGMTPDNAPIYDASIQNGRMFSSSVFYPASGQRLSQTGVVSYTQYMGSWWSAQPYNNSGTLQAYSLQIDPTRVRPAVKVGIAYGATIRCIKE